VEHANVNEDIIPTKVRNIGNSKPIIKMITKMQFFYLQRKKKHFDKLTEKKKSEISL
jgi:hypothetical protein